MNSTVSNTSDDTETQFRLRKHVTKGAGERVVQAEKGAPRIVYYVGLESNHDVPAVFKRHAKIRKEKVQDGNKEDVQVKQGSSGTEGQTFSSP